MMAPLPLDTLQPPRMAPNVLDCVDNLVLLRKKFTSKDEEDNVPRRKGRHSGLMKENEDVLMNKSK